MMQIPQIELMTREQQAQIMEYLKKTGVDRTKYDGLINKHRFLSIVKNIAPGEFNAHRIIHTVEDLIPCNSCRRKYLTRGLHQVINYNTRADLNDIPTEYDKHITTIKQLTDIAYYRATFERRLKN